MLAQAPILRVLPPNAEPLDQLAIAAFVLALHIVEQPAALAHKLKKPSARMVIFLVGLEMFRQVADLFRENGNLNFRRTGIAFGLVAYS